MSEWGIALIAAGSAIAGSIVTGFFAWKAGHRQAAAAEAAGHAQANALISTVQATLDEQRRTRAIDQRRQVYVQLLDAGERLRNSVLASASASAATIEDVRATLSMVVLEGPDPVVAAARAYADALDPRGGRSSEDRSAKRDAYIEAVRQVLLDA
ncbi:hypothetical protein ACIGN6_31925 [Streptomyces sp. NPDC053792]|uniref:hypothetical protein n=1 Tax=Streptomyces sp. NPDC053792 TaxID=3365716 RepID=UPI0037D4FFC6